MRMVLSLFCAALEVNAIVWCSISRPGELPPSAMLSVAPNSIVQVRSSVMDNCLGRYSFRRERMVGSTVESSVGRGGTVALRCAVAVAVLE